MDCDMYSSFQGDDARRHLQQTYDHAVGDGHVRGGMETMLPGQQPVGMAAMGLPSPSSRDIMGGSFPPAANNGYSGLPKSMANVGSLFTQLVDKSQNWNMMPDYPGDVPQRDDMGVSGAGVNSTNQPNTHGIDLDPMGYGQSYETYNQMQRLLPIGSLIFIFLPGSRTTVGNTSIIHTVTTLNRYLASSSETERHPCYKGEHFDSYWEYAGILCELDMRQDMETGRQLFRATVCYSGPAVIQNIFCNTGAQFQCGNGLYLLRRRMLRGAGSLSITADAAKVDNFVVGVVDEFSEENSNLYRYLHQTPDTPVNYRPVREDAYYYQLQTVVSASGSPPAAHLYNGPDWNGSYYRIGTVHKRDDISTDPLRNSMLALDAIHSVPHDHDAWVNAMGKLDRLEILVGSV